MKTEQTTTIRGEKGVENALAMTEKLGADYGLERKSVLHLRLLAEELFGMIRGIAGNIVSEYKISAEDKKFELHLKSEVEMTVEMRDKLISVSSSGKNAAATGFTGRIRVLIAEALLSMRETAPYAVINTASAYSPVWMMSDYKSDVMKNADTDKTAKQAWDELEKSVLAKIADDIKVGVVGNSVEIIIYKAF
ncbi:MAG: hypothetical protein IJT49_01720 [Clostridia bacterium]|nr:hypothetical protein [Clostridia bacterium]